jgi:hypothetical protein
VKRRPTRRTHPIHPAAHQNKRKVNHQGRKLYSTNNFMTNSF